MPEGKITSSRTGFFKRPVVPLNGVPVAPTTEQSTIPKLKKITPYLSDVQAKQWQQNDAIRQIQEADNKPMFKVPTTSQTPAAIEYREYKFNPYDYQHKNAPIVSGIRDAALDVASYLTAFAPTSEAEKREAYKNPLGAASQIMTQGLANEMVGGLMNNVMPKPMFNINFMEKTPLESIANKVINVEEAVKNKANQAYKINPWAFKPNPESYYRMIGKEGYKDALENGVIRANPGKGGQSGVMHNDPYFSIKYPWNGTKYKGMYGDPGIGYDGPYMAEIKNHPMSSEISQYPRNNIAIPKETIKLDNPNLKFYKEHWLQGYKEVPIINNNLTPIESATAKAERMVSQKNKFSSVNKDAIEKFKNIEKNFIIDKSSNHVSTPDQLGRNTGDKAILFSDATEMGKPLTKEQQAYVSAHETDHFYKNTIKESKDWQSAFDTKLLNSYLKGNPIVTENIGTGINLNRNIGSSIELRARAGQLKDFIAKEKNIPLNKNFKVKKEDLDNALNKFVNKTGLDNDMTQFIYSINNKKKLLKNMNKYALSGVVGTSYFKKKE